MTIAPTWDSQEYQRIKGVIRRGDTLVVDFEDGFQATVDAHSILPPNSRGVDWSSLSWNPYEISVPGDGGQIEIPWSTIRALSDKRYATHLATLAEEQARQIGLRVKELRLARGIASKELAERAGIAPQSLSRIERGHHDVVFTTLQRILAAMGCSLRDLTAGPQAPTSLDPLLKRLARAGIDRDFALRRLVPREKRPHPHSLDDPLEAALLQKVALGTSRVFQWSVPSILDKGPLALNSDYVPLPLFKVQGKANQARLRAYTFYAHFLAEKVIQATPGMASDAVPDEPQVVRQAVLARYDTLNFSTLLRYAWDLGIAVIPLRDPGGFHGASWRIKGRNVIVLKQVTDSQARWSMDLAHELKHIASHISDTRPVVIESEEMKPTETSGEEGEASGFASDLLLFGRAEELAQQAVAEAQSEVERLKSAVQRVAAIQHVPADALANYLAFRLSDQGINWWGAANNLQVTEPPPWKTARDALLERIDLGLLSETDRGLLQRAVSEPEEL